MTAVDRGPPNSIEVSVAVDGEAAEAVCELFERHGGGAVVEIRVASEDGSGAPTSPEATVRTYLDATDVEARAKVEEGLWYLSRIYPLPEASIRTLARANWAEAWKAHYEPLRIGQRTLVVPSWLDPDPADDDVVLRLDPGMAFGTGLHPTTRLCLALVEELAGPGTSVVDVGTGSGILAIGSAKWGAGPVFGCDTDPLAVETAEANAALNAVELSLFVGSLDAVPGPAFDLVVANILAEVIRGMAPDLASRVQPGGHLVVSGILDDQGPGVADTLAAQGLELVSERHEKDWLAGLWRRPVTKGEPSHTGSGGR